MIKSLLTKLLLWKVGRKALVPVAKAVGLLSGKRTEILLGVAVVLYVLELAGLLPEGTARKAAELLGAAGAVTLMDKVKDHEDVVKLVVEESQKPL